MPHDVAQLRHHRRDGQDLQPPGPIPLGDSGVNAMKPFLFVVSVIEFSGFFYYLDLSYPVLRFTSGLNVIKLFTDMIYEFL